VKLPNSLRFIQKTFYKQKEQKKRQQLLNGQLTFKDDDADFAKSIQKMQLITINNFNCTINHH